MIIERVEVPAKGWYTHYQNGINLLKRADQAAADNDAVALDDILEQIGKHFNRARVDLRHRIAKDSHDLSR